MLLVERVKGGRRIRIGFLGVDGIGILKKSEHILPGLLGTSGVLGLSHKFGKFITTWGETYLYFYKILMSPVMAFSWMTLGSKDSGMSSIFKI